MGSVSCLEGSGSDLLQLKVSVLIQTSPLVSRLSRACQDCSNGAHDCEIMPRVSLYEYLDRKNTILVTELSSVQYNIRSYSYSSTKYTCMYWYCMYVCMYDYIHVLPLTLVQ